MFTSVEPQLAPQTTLPRLAEIRLAIAIGHPIRERHFLEIAGQAAEDGAHIRVVRRCLDAAELVRAMRDDNADVFVVGADLHGLGTEAGLALSDARQPVLLWAAPGDQSDRSKPRLGTSAAVLPPDLDASDLRAALESTVRAGGRLRRPRRTHDVAHSAASHVDASPTGPGTGDSMPLASGPGTIVALVGPPGGHGVSTTAIGLSAALSRLASVALVDLNLALPGVAAALDLNPARNLYMVLHEAGQQLDPRVWSTLLQAELQPLDPAAPQGVVLAGVPGSSLAGDVGPDSVRQLLRELARHERFVVADVGTDLESSTATGIAQRAALEAADRVLVVARADVSGLRRASLLLARLRGLLGGSPERVAVVVNRHQPRHHHDAGEVARALRTSVAAVIPEDSEGVQTALSAQRALVAFGGTRRGSAARAILDLAATLDTGSSVRSTTRTLSPSAAVAGFRAALQLAWRR